MPGLAGLTIPGLANCHSHAFHRALRGRTQRGAGHVLDLARADVRPSPARLDPDTYFALARATYREMAGGGHHQRRGVPLPPPPARRHAVRRPQRDGARARVGAAEAGVRIALLDTCYLSSGFGKPPEGVQSRFSDGDAAEHWADRGAGDGLGARSTRCGRCRSDAARDGFRGPSSPLHVHLSEQVAENDECLAAYGRTPTELLAEAGLLGPSHHRRPRHPPHRRRRRAARRRPATTACFCPTTERDLGDGIGPAARPPRRRRAGSPSAATATPSSTCSRR